jgi:ribosomal protein S15P/S13E
MTSETSVNFHNTTRRNIPEDCHLYTHRRENVKSHLEEKFSDMNISKHSSKLICF